MVGDRCTAARGSFKKTLSGAISCCSTNTSMATTERALAPATRRGGPGSSPGASICLRPPRPSSSWNLASGRHSLNENASFSTCRAPAMTPRYGTLFQINTRVWLTELSRALHRRATLDDVPDAELDRLADLGFDWIW